MNENMIGVLIFIAISVVLSLIKKAKEASEQKQLEEERAARRAQRSQDRTDLPEATRRQLYGEDDGEWIPVDSSGTPLEEESPSRPVLQARPAAAPQPPPLRREFAAPAQPTVVLAPAPQESPAAGEMRRLQDVIMQMRQQMQQMQQTYQRTEIERRRLADNEARQRAQYQRMLAERQAAQRGTDSEGRGAPGEGTSDGEGPAAARKRQQQRQRSSVPPPLAPPRRPALFGNLGEIRRGIILAEVLGKPKGLQD